MTTWIYKATMSRRDYTDTETLALSYNFLCRSLYRRPKVSAALVRQVALGDTMYFYYRRNDRARTVEGIGTFKVVDGRNSRERFAGFAENTALLKVADSPSNGGFLAMLRKKPTAGEGYHVDPVLKVFTGWALEDLRRAPPDFDQGWFPNAQTTLYRHPDSGT